MLSRLLQTARWCCLPETDAALLFGVLAVCWDCMVRLKGVTEEWLSHAG